MLGQFLNSGVRGEIGPGSNLNLGRKKTTDIWVFVNNFNFYENTMIEQLYFLTRDIKMSALKSKYN